MYVYPEDKGQVCSTKGHYAEDLFVKTYNEKFGNKPVKTSVDEDRYYHQDFKFKLNNQNLTCDVKYPKKITRHDTKVSDKYIWIEFITKGYPGWLFGKQDYLAFLMPDFKTFKLVKRDELFQVCCQLVDIHTVVTDIRDALYKIYRRSNRFGYKHDMISLIKYEDLDRCPSNIVFSVN